MAHSLAFVPMDYRLLFKQRALADLAELISQKTPEVCQKLAQPVRAGDKSQNKLKRRRRGT